MRRQISRSPSRTPGASISISTTGSGPPSSGRTVQVFIAPSCVAISSSRSIMPGRYRPCDPWSITAARNAVRGVKPNARGESGGAGRPESHRPVARAGRPLLRPDAGRPRRRGDQGRAAAGRRDPPVGAAVRPGRHLRLFLRHQPQQAHDRARPLQAGRPRRAAEAARAGRRADRQFQDRHDGEMGHRLRRHALQEIPAPGPCPRLGLRRRRSAGRLPGLRRHGAGLGRAGLGQRRARERPGAHRRAGGRSVDRHERLHGHPDGALRAQPVGQGPVRRRHALRQRRRAAPAACAQLFHGRPEAQALRQQPRQPGALRQLPDQGPQHRDRRRQRRAVPQARADAGQARAGRRSALQDQQGSAGPQARARSRAARAHQGPRRRELRQRADEERRAVGRGDGSARRHGASAHQASRHGVGEGRLPKRRQSGEALAHAAQPRAASPGSSAPTPGRCWASTATRRPRSTSWWPPASR